MSVTLTEEQLELGSKLTPLQRKTVINLATGKMSQREAYYAAGGKAKKPETADASVSEILGNPKVKVFYESLMNAAASDAVMTRQEALERLTRAARVTMTDIAEFAEQVVGEDEAGNPVKQTVWRIKNSDELTPEAAAAIKSVTATKFGPKLELHDPHSAIKQIADMEGWNAPSKHEVTGKDGKPLQIQADVKSPDIAAAINKVLERL